MPAARGSRGPARTTPVLRLADPSRRCTTPMLVVSPGQVALNAVTDGVVARQPLADRAGLLERRHGLGRPTRMMPLQMPMLL